MLTQLPSDGLVLYPSCTRNNPRVYLIMKHQRNVVLWLSKYLSVGDNVKPFALQSPSQTSAKPGILMDNAQILFQDIFGGHRLDLWGCHLEAMSLIYFPELLPSHRYRQQACRPRSLASSKLWLDHKMLSKLLHLYASFGKGRATNCLQ